MRLLATALLALLNIVPVAAQDDVAAPKVTVSSDLSQLPEAVQQKRQDLIEAALSGDIEALRPIIDAQTAPPTVSYGGPDDAVDYLKTASADGAGIESLAILLNLLNAPYAVLDTGGDSPSYVWPYLAVLPDLTTLTDAQKVDAYRIMDHQQFTGLAEMGGWYYWRVYIAENGEWQAFVAGD